MGRNQVPVDLPGEERVDMLIARGFVRTVEDDVVSVAHARHQLDAAEPAQSEDRLALALGVGMQRVRPDYGTVLHQPVDDVDRFPDAARDESGEQRNVVVGDMVIGNTAVAAIPDVLGADEIVLAQRNMGAIGDCRSAGTPELGQREASIGVDHVAHRCFEFGRIDMLRINPAQRLGGGDAGGVTRGLAGAEIAALSAQFG